MACGRVEYKREQVWESSVQVEGKGRGIKVCGVFCLQGWLVTGGREYGGALTGVIKLVSDVLEDMGSG